MLFEVAATKKLVEEYRAFAEACVETNKDLYRNRNQRNVSKIADDIFYGKLGEYGAYEFLKSLGHPPNEPPDIKVYKKRNKTFGADLQIGMTNVHVKSQSLTSADKYGMSWTFQWNGRTDTGNRKRNHHDPVLDDPEGLIVFCVVSEAKGNTLPRIQVQAVLPIKDVVPKYLELPKLDYLKEYKRVVYFGTLKSKFKNLLQIT